MEFESGDYPLHDHSLIYIEDEHQPSCCSTCGLPLSSTPYYKCEQGCNFFLHSACRQLPQELNHFSSIGIPYSLALVAKPPHNQENWTCDKCSICDEKFYGKAAYYCPQCDCCAHLNCVSSRIKISGYQPVQFPLEEADKRLFIYKMLDKRRIEKNEEDEKLSIEKYHNHPLIFHDNIDIDDKDYSSLCVACIRPSNSPPFYMCQEPGCNFLLHKECMNLPSEIDLNALSSTEKPSALKLKTNEILSIFKCDVCRQKCNGFRYEFKVLGHYKTLSAHVECASLPRIIRHQLHYKRHILCLVLRTQLDMSFFTCCPNRTHPFVYKCASCHFAICINCALLPTKVSHKFDKHFLQLSSEGRSSTNVNDNKNCFCEICENYVDTKFWFYHCMECEQFFHIKCIPLVGVLSNIKFGCTLVISCHPEDHRVTLTRMLDIGNQSCGECKEIIQGFVDDMAFQCSKCCYWVHFHCALPEVAQKLEQNEIDEYF